MGEAPRSWQARADRLPLRWPLLAPAAAAWLVALGLIGRTATAAWACAALGMAVLVPGFLLLRGGPRARALWGVALMAAAVATSAIGVRCAVGAEALAAEPWATWAAGRAAVDVSAIAQEPAVAARRTTPWGGGSTLERVVVEVRSAKGEDGRPWTMGSPALLLLDRQDAGAPAPIGVGDEVRVRVRVSAGDSRRGSVATLTSVGTAEVEPASGVLAGVRDAARSTFVTAGGDRPAAGALALGMVIGDDSGVPGDAQQDMRDAGLTHLTAVSGANIAMVLGAVLFLARLVLTGTGQRGLRLALVVAVVALAGFVAVVGPAPSVLRATVMALVGVAALALGGRGGASALLVAVLVLLLLDPWLAASWGFALSVAATAGLIAVAGVGARLARAAAGRAPPRLRLPVTLLVGALVISAAAAAATAPLLAAFGQGVSWISVVANMAVAPAVPVITVVGLVAIVLGPCWPAGAVALAEVPAWGAGLVLDVAGAAAEVPGGRLPWPQGPRWALLLAVLLVLGLVVGRRWPRHAAVLALVVAVGSVAFAEAPAVLGRGLPADWRVLFCDVGQGDAVLLRSGADSAVLVDVGPSDDAAAQCVVRSGVRTVDAVVLSHFHRDHVGGLAAVLAQWRPTSVVVSPLPEPADTYREVVRTVAAHGLTMVVPALGAQTRVGWASWTIVGPRRIIRDGSAPNNASLVMLAEVGPGEPLRTLLGGDLEPAGQSALMGGMAPPAVDVAKVPHHGSARQHPGLPGWAGAAAAVISVGADNDYGHPAPATVEAWRRAGAVVLRTDQGGDVAVVLDGAAGRARIFTGKGE